MLVRRFVSLFGNKWVKIALCALLFAASAIIVVALLLGNEAGTFVIKVQDGNLDKSIAITDSTPTDNLRSKLSADGAKDMTDYNPAYFLDNNKYSMLTNISSHMGRWLGDSDTAGYVAVQLDSEGFVENKDNLYVIDYASDGEQYYRKIEDSDEYDPSETYYVTLASLSAQGVPLFAYTFYVVNTSTDNTSVQFKASMNYSNVTNHCDEICRIMTFTQGTEENSTLARIYYKQELATNDYSEDDSTDFASYKTDAGYDSKGYYQNHGYDEELAPLSTFQSNNQVFSNQAYRIEANGYMKFTILFWLEGEDPDETYYPKVKNETVFSGTIKFSLTLSVDMTV